MSSTYLSHIDGFSDVDPNAVSSKYSMYMLANTTVKIHHSISTLCQRPSRKYPKDI